VTVQNEREAFIGQYRKVPEASALWRRLAFSNRYGHAGKPAGAKTSGLRIRGNRRSRRKILAPAIALRITKEPLTAFRTLQLRHESFPASAHPYLNTAFE
jgi:hypothetical protein